MEHYSTEKLNETFLCRLTNQRFAGDIGDLNNLKARLIGDVTIDDKAFTHLLLIAQEKKIIQVKLAPKYLFKRQGLIPDMGPRCRYVPSSAPTLHL